MNVQLTVLQLWALVAGGPIAMVITVLVGIIINNSVNKASIDTLRSDMKRVEDTLRSDMKRIEDSLRSDMKRVEDTLRSDMKRVEDSLHSDIRRVEDSLRSEILRVEGVLSVKLDVLTARVKALEDEIHSPLVRQ